MFSELDGPQSILIIDDNITNLRVAVSYLQAYSFEILIANNGIDGLERARSAEPDLILLDVQMPGIDGFEVCKRLKANPKTAAIPVIFMTALNDVQDKVRGLEAGAVDYVTKPIESPELLARVNTHLQMRYLQSQLKAMNANLEEQVQTRTAELESEIEQRKRQEAEKDHLMQVMVQQSEHMRNMTQIFAVGQYEQRKGMQEAMGINQGQLNMLEQKLDVMGEMLTDPRDEARTALAATYLEEVRSLIQSIKASTNAVSLSLDQSAADQKEILDNPLLQLSAREREVLRLLAIGKSRKEIADLLVISPGTVSTYRKRIMQKLDVEDNAGLIMIAADQGLT